MSEVKYVYLTWSQIDNQCNFIVEQIKKSGKSFDTIISIGRGGMIPSRILSDRLSIDTIYMYNIKLYKGVNLRNNKPVVENFNYRINNKNVLIVDDICDSCTSVEYVYSDLITKKPRNLYVATLFCKKHVKRKPFYFAIESEENEWICFPWEKNEFRK